MRGVASRVGCGEVEAHMSMDEKQFFAVICSELHWYLSLLVGGGWHVRTRVPGEQAHHERNGRVLSKTSQDVRGTRRG